MITAIVLPADMDQPIRQQHIKPTDIAAYRDLVGVNLEVVELFRPSASLYINEEGKLNDLPLNQRATVITWVHNSAFRGHDLILGDAFIVGAVDRNGDDLTVPQELVTLLFDTPSYRIEVQTAGGSQWSGNRLRWGNWFETVCVRHRPGAALEAGTGGSCDRRDVATDRPPPGFKISGGGGQFVCAARVRNPN